MKKLAIFLVAVVLALGMSNIVMAQHTDHMNSTWNDGLGIAGSTHDFADGISRGDGGTAGEAWNTTGELCRTCHVPHDNGAATVRYVDGLLWNHDLSAEASYELYTSPSFDGTNGGQPSGISRLCLGCHDGTIALDAFGDYVGGTSGQEMGTIGLSDFVIPNKLQAGISNDLRGTHPLSMDFDPLSTELNDAASTMITIPAGPIAGTTYPLSDVIFDGQVQCASCHDVHNQESAPDSHLLRVDNTGSGLCLTCHIK